MEIIAEYIKSAIKQLIGNKTRTLMTMLGIVIGIASVIIVIALGNGMSDYITTQLNNTLTSSGNIAIDPLKTTERITQEDMDDVKEKISELNGISPVYSESERTVKITTSRGTFLSTLIARSEGGLYAKGREMAAGTYFSRQQVDTLERVCVMMDTDADKIFGTRNCIGMPIELMVGSKSAEYTVIGLRQSDHSFLDMFNDANRDFYASIEIPYTSYGNDFDVNVDSMTLVEVYADGQVLNDVTKKAYQIIARNHDLAGSNAISSRITEGLADMFGSIIRNARYFMILVAIVSLVVGGIGIMNIMLVSVTERTREIGIRKSIGARTTAVMAQFLAESAFLSFIGGVLGIIVGIIISAIGCRILSFELRLSPAEVLLAGFFSIILGLFFGLYPARKAAGMKPIDALRNILTDGKNTRVRNILTMLGIIIGIMSVLLILVISDGYEEQMKLDLNKKASSIIIKVDPTKTEKFITRDLLSRLSEHYNGQIYGIDLVDTISADGQSVSYRGQEVTVNLFGDGNAILQENAMTLLKGRFYDFDELINGDYVCVIPENVATKIFGYSDILGKQLTISVKNKSHDFTVIGIIATSDWDISQENKNIYECYIPFITACDVLEIEPDEKLTEVKLIVDHDHVESALRGLASLVENMLDIRGLGAVRVSREDTMSGYDRIMSMIKYVGAVIAAISIIVGGIGIMNIMTVTVEERTREIGIRKSIGARTSYIMLQFLTETARLTLAGGFIGVVLGLALSFVVCRFIGFPFVVNPLAVVLVAGLSVLVGVFFGIAPAYKASKLKPIDALRTE